MEVSVRRVLFRGVRPRRHRRAVLEGNGRRGYAARAAEPGARGRECPGASGWDALSLVASAIARRGWAAVAIVRAGTRRTAIATARRASVAMTAAAITR